MKGCGTVTSAPGPTFDFKFFFHVIIHVVLQNYVAKTLNCCINMLLICIADIIGTYKDFLN